MSQGAEACARALDQALAASSADEVLAAVARAWAAWPHSRLSALARALGTAARPEALGGPTQAAREDAWHELAPHANALEVGRLLLTPWPKSPKQARARLDALERRGADPRVALALVELETGERFLSPEGDRFWQRAWDVLLGWGSPEAAAALLKFEAADPTTPTAALRKNTVFAPVLTRWRDRLPVDRPVPAELASRLETLEAKARPHAALTDGLIAAVHAAPADDRPRYVLADALAEQGDPRGEFLTLQFAHANGELSLSQREKMQRLLDASGAAWLEPFGGQVAPVAVFSRGFPSQVRLVTRQPDPSPPAWRSIEAVDLAALALPISSFLDHPHLAGLRSLTHVAGPTLRELARRGAAREWDSLEVDGGGARDVERPAWKVRRLMVRGFVDQTAWWLEGSPLLAAAQTVVVPLEVDFSRVGPALAKLAGWRGVLSFALRPGRWPESDRGEWELSFEPGDEVGRARVRLVLHADDGFDELKQACQSLPPRLVETLVVTTSLKRGPGWRTDVTERVEEAFAGQDFRAAFELDAPVRRPIAPAIFRGR
ncbi:MAG: TIGR02996 domain-containing protein [Myxococcaceae bacterium]